MTSWIDPMRQKICIAAHLPENILLFRTLEARRIAMRGRPPAPSGGKRHAISNKPEVRAKIEVAETAKQSAAIKAAWARPEVRAKVMAGFAPITVAVAPLKPS
jgi:hypothetical protein